MRPLKQSQFTLQKAWLPQIRTGYRTVHIVFFLGDELQGAAWTLWRKSKLNVSHDD